MYSSDDSEWSQHNPTSPLFNSLQSLFLKYGVDMYLSGHMHMFESIYPVDVNGTVVSKPQSYGGLTNVFVRPKSPVRVVQGTAGIFMFVDTYKNPAPEWSFARDDKFGYGRLTFHNASLAQFEYLETEHDNRAHPSSFYILK